MKTEAIVHHQPSHCLNCGAHAPASFCQHCGQETHVQVPGAGEYVHEFIGHYVALENKLWKTLALLLFKPGRLTRDYIEGKRVRYVLPLRLYLTLSLVFFAVVQWDAHGLAEQRSPEEVKVEQKAKLANAQRKIDAAKKKFGEAAMAQAQADIDAAKAKADSGEDVTSSMRFLTLGDSDLKWVSEHIGARVAEKAAKFGTLKGDEQLREAGAAFFHYAPYAIFALMPVFALCLKLLYLGSGRRYGEHLLFALHTNAFAFLTLTLMLALPSGIPYLRPALGLWLTFYLPTAMRKVYGGSRLATWTRWMILMFLHVLGMMFAMVGAMVLAVVA